MNWAGNGRSKVESELEREVLQGLCHNGEVRGRARVYLTASFLQRVDYYIFLIIGKRR